MKKKILFILATVFCLSAFSMGCSSCTASNSESNVTPGEQEIQTDLYLSEQDARSISF